MNKIKIIVSSNTRSIVTFDKNLAITTFLNWCEINENVHITIIYVGDATSHSFGGGLGWDKIDMEDFTNWFANVIDSI